MKVGDIFVIDQDFIYDGQKPILAGIEYKICVVSSDGKLITTDVGDGFPQIPSELIKIVGYSQISVQTAEETPLIENKSVRLNQGKPQLHYVPYSVLTSIAEGFMAGESKRGYDKWNWKKPKEFSVAWDSAQRHLWKFKEGVDIDEETGVHHIKLALCNLTILLHNIENHPDMDDRTNVPKQKKP
jgi:hypothetical protein